MDAGIKPKSRHVGNQQLRVTVDKPTTLQDLQAHANRHFGHNGPLQLWHKGESQIHAHHHVNNLVHDDLIVVTWGDQKPPEGFTAISTHKADFVKHPLSQLQLPPTPRTPLRIPFEAKSSYLNDFVKHPLSKTAPGFGAAPAWKPTDGSTGKTTYNTHFVKHPAGRSLPTAPTNRVGTPLPFDGKSSYTQDYVKHHLNAGPAPTTSNRDVELPYVPFEGHTTYNRDYLEKPVLPRSAPSPRRPRSKPLPFNSHTEYRKEFTKKHQDKHHIHIEPAHHLTAHLTAR